MDLVSGLHSDMWVLREPKNSHPIAPYLTFLGLTLYLDPHRTALEYTGLGLETQGSLLLWQRLETGSS